MLKSNRISVSKRAASTVANNEKAHEEVKKLRRADEDTAPKFDDNDYYFFDEFEGEKVSHIDEGNDFLYLASDLAAAKDNCDPEGYLCKSRDLEDYDDADFDDTNLTYGYVPVKDDPTKPRILNCCDPDFQSNLLCDLESLYPMSFGADSFWNKKLDVSKHMQDSDKITSSYGVSFFQPRQKIEEGLDKICVLLSLPKSGKELIMNWFNESAGVDKCPGAPKLRPASQAKLLTFVYEYDCCDCGGAVYTGKYASSKCCPACDKSRYGGGDDSAALKRILYRSLVYLLCSLIETGLFLEFLTYRGVDVSSNEHYSDSYQHGDNPRMHIDQMHTNYHNHPDAENMIEVSLILTTYFDGVQLFHHRTGGAWPLMVSITNLPPCFRKVRGMGIFTLTAMSVEPDSPVGLFLQELFVQELFLLYNGIRVTIGGKVYFLQARLISNVYDTRGAEMVLMARGAGSYCGCCYCRAMQGFGMGEFNKVVYYNHRIFLHLDHFLNYLGQTGTCCPRQYCTDSKFRQDYIAKLPKWEDYESHESFVVSASSAKAFIDSMCDDCAENREYVNSFLTSTGAWLWHHDKRGPYKLQHFVANMYYPFADGRPRSAMERVTSKQYKEDADKIAENPKMEHSNGIKGFWMQGHLPYVNFARDINPDWFHTLMNVAKLMLPHFLNLNNEGAVSTKVIAYCMAHNMHPKLVDLSKKKNAKAAVDGKEVPTSCRGPWAMPNLESVHVLMELFFLPVLFPSGYSDTNSLKKLTKTFGFFKGVHVIHIVECAMDYITFVYATLFEKNKDIRPYLLLYRMVSDLFSRLLAPMFLKTEVEPLYELAVEVVCSYEAMFPPSESNMISHQIVHLPRYIKEHGPLRCWGSLPSERAMASYAKCYARGGRYADLASQNKAFTEEFSLLKTLYSKDPDSHEERFKMAGRSFGPSHTTSSKQTPAYVYDEFYFHMSLRIQRSKPQYTCFSCLKTYGGFQQAQFLSFLVEESRRLYGVKNHKGVASDARERAALMSQSSIYRMFAFFLSRHKDYMVSVPNGSEEVSVSRPTQGKSCEFYYWLVAFITAVAASDSDVHDRFSITELMPIWEDITAGRSIWREDIYKAKALLDFLHLEQHRFFNRSTVWGIDFNAREANSSTFTREYGHPTLVPRQYTETKEDNIRSYAATEKQIRMTNPLNVLSDLAYSTSWMNWDVSSWCRVHYLANRNCSSFAGSDSPSDFQVAHIHYFGVIQLPEVLFTEPVNHLPFAHVTSRITKRIMASPSTSGQEPYENLWRIDFDDSKSYDYEGNSFVATYNIIPTPLAIIPLSFTPEKKLKPFDKNYRKSSLYFYALKRRMECLFRTTEVLHSVHPYFNCKNLAKIKEMSYACL